MVDFIFHISVDCLASWRSSKMFFVPLVKYHFFILKKGCELNADKKQCNKEVKIPKWCFRIENYVVEMQTEKYTLWFMSVSWRWDSCLSICKWGRLRDSKIVRGIQSHFVSHGWKISDQRLPLNFSRYKYVCKYNCKTHVLE